MPGKLHAHHAAALQRKQSAQSHNHFTPSRESTPVLIRGKTSAGAADSDGEDDDSEQTPTKSKEAVQAPSIAGGRPITPMTPTTQPRQLLAGLDLNLPKASRTDASAIDMKMAELQARGWRPEEELASTGADDDEDYEGVDLISNCDEDDAAIRATENEMFKDPDMSLQQQGDLARRLSLSDAGDDDEVEWNGFDDAGFTSFADSFTADDAGLPSFMSKAYEETQISKNDNQRRVRFLDEVDKSDDSDESGQTMDEFPDIFTDFHIKPYYARGEDVDIDEASDAGSVWDFDGDEMDIDDDDDDDDNDDDDTASFESDASSSDYDSDEGDTTDEETCEPMHRPSLSPTQHNTPPKSQKEGEDEAKLPNPKELKAKKIVTRSRAQGRSTTSPVHHTPRFGTFELDPRRNVLIVSGAGVNQKNKLYPAKIQTPSERRFWQKLKESYKNSSASPRTSVQMDIDDDSDYEMDHSMFSPDGPFNSAGTLRADQVVGPAEAFHPFTSVDASGVVTENTSMASFSEDDDTDVLTPFVNFDAHSDGEGEDESASTSDALVTRQRSNTEPSFPSSTPATPHTPSLRRADTANSDQGALSHLTHTPSLVSSFRLNQEIAKELASYASDPSARFLRSEQNAMQAGRRRAANTPITPLRKKRGDSLSKIGNVSWSKGLNLDKDVFLTDSKKKAPQHVRRSSTGRGIGRMGKGSIFR